MASGASEILLLHPPRRAGSFHPSTPQAGEGQETNPSFASSPGSAGEHPTTQLGPYEMPVGAPAPPSPAGAPPSLAGVPPWGFPHLRSPPAEPHHPSGWSDAAEGPPRPPQLCDTTRVPREPLWRALRRASFLPPLGIAWGARPETQPWPRVPHGHGGHLPSLAPPALAGMCPGCRWPGWRGAGLSLPL